jgi:hypothetical protein
MIYALSILTGVCGEGDIRYANGVRLSAGLLLGMPLDILTVVRLAQDHFGLAGLVVHRSPASASETYAVYPRGLRSGKVVALHIARCHCWILNGLPKAAPLDTVCKHFVERGCVNASEQGWLVTITITIIYYLLSIDLFVHAFRCDIYNDHGHLAVAGATKVKSKTRSRT